MCGIDEEKWKSIRKKERILYTKPSIALEDGGCLHPFHRVFHKDTSPSLKILGIRDGVSVNNAIVYGSKKGAKEA